MTDSQPANDVTKPRRRVRKGLIVFVAVMLAFVLALGALSWIPLKRARAEWRAGRIAAAIDEANRWSRLRFWPNQYREVLAASYLSVGNRDAAKQPLESLRGKKLWISVIPKREVANRLFARGAYEDFLAYDDAVRSEEAPLYRAASLLATGKLADAENAMRDVDDADPKKRASLERAIAQRKEGTYPYVLDRDGKTIAMYQVENRDVVAVNVDFAPLIEKDAGALTIEAHAERIGANDLVETTLDSAVQKAAMSALAGFRGALVAIDPRSNEVLAIASNKGNGPMRNLALEQQYEPGSVVKVLTGLDAVASGLPMDTMFPYTCNGELMIDGRHFGDWLPTGHGELTDLDESLAESCNVVFADIGIRLGVDRLRPFMTSAGFGGQTDIGLFKVPLGRTVGDIFNKFETAYYAIGLEHATTNALHMAIVASTMANRGVLTQPRVIRARRSMLGELVGTQPRLGSARIASQEASERIVKAMVAVVTDDRGTGRRAKIDGVSLAMKTGTAGKREDGYHAVIIGFAPVEQPKIAFAMIAEDSGPAEYAGAKIIHDFLEGVKGRLR